VESIGNLVTDVNEIFAILPEDCVPNDAEGCSRCELAAQRKRIIWGEGQPGAPIMVLLDNPGAREDKTGASFVCGSRKTLQSLAQQSGINLDRLYITYVVKCRPLRSYNKRHARMTCIEYFYEQVKDHKPKVILCLGNVALQTLFDDDSAEVKKFRGQWHLWNGLPLAVSYHPLAIRRRPNLFPYAILDWEIVAKKIGNL
jgi:uracil-DNA glycosylase family 4